MTETRWRVTDPQNRIRRLAPVADGTVNVEIVLPSNDPAAVAAVERAARDDGIVIERLAADAAVMGTPMMGGHAAVRNPPDSVVVNGVQYVPAHPVLPS